MVVLPDHWHSLWTLPPGDHGYARRIRLIKARFTSGLVRDGVNIAKDERGEYQLWQKNSGSTPFETIVTLNHMSTMCTSIRSSMRTLRGPSIGRIRPSIDM